ncbi:MULTISPECIES: peptidoglycan-binding domain-containing protein [Streptomyces]|uniref:peptidoglycan-binding domain-containing protein n=1 Tax=Streptomyces TaxID=1883 RepID=UPI00068BA69D|nr:peptidoglycan-binding domain-containing protein [Streptomyces sp. NRRL F-5193]
MKLSMLAAAVLAAALLPVVSASAVPSTTTTVHAPSSATSCRESIDGVYCGYDRSNAYTDRGDAGAKVKEVQALLIYQGYSMGSGGVDGYFGAGTESAVKRFQAAKGLRADGIVGASTWAWLRSER